jgi:hypothetical protein
LAFPHEGRHFDLREIFDRVNADYFSNRMRGYKIIWGRKRRQRPKTTFVFASIQEEDRLIKVHPLLDAPFVPLWFMEYVVYHEMLHAFVPEEQTSTGRRVIHTKEFYRREQQFRLYRKARRWESENLGRFLR